MLRTLYLYIGRELLRVTILGLVAFTLVMTMLAIIEPMRKQGLASDQVLALFGYTMPVMVSLTLPIAALFASTMVYGRLSQDNEMVACRASGISMITILKPALFLGLVVTTVSLLLSNFVAPQLTRMAESKVKSNIREIINNKLLTRGFIKFNEYVIHADSLSPDRMIANGVAFGQYRKGKKPGDQHEWVIGVASGAQMEFPMYDGELYAKVSCRNATAFRDPVGDSKKPDRFFPRSEAMVIEYPVPWVYTEKVAFYDWNKLMETYASPEKHGEIKRLLEGIRRKIIANMASAEIAEVVNSGKAYEKLKDAEEMYTLSAPKATHASGGTVTLEGDVSGENRRQVELRVYSTTSSNTTKICADRAEIEIAWRPSAGRMLASILLSGEITVANIGINAEKDMTPRRQEMWQRGDIWIPSDIEAKVAEIKLEDIYDNASAITSDPVIRGELDAIKKEQVRKIKGDIIAEMHVRMAYGTSCFLMVAIGAALGILFRGGQVVSAFALALVPAALVIILMMMGKNMVVGKRAAEWGVTPGLIIIWSGNVLLTIGAAVIYGILARK